ncbi:MAG: sodium/proline symporter [Thermodesulfobacteriota bacterium]
MVLASFIFFMALFLTLGIIASRRSRGSSKDYMLAGREIPPFLTALSAASTCNSGFWFTAMIGFVYVHGFHAVWVVAGFTLGDLMMSLRVYPGVRSVSESRGAITFSELLARWTGEEFRYVRLACAFLTLFFLSVYAGAQFFAGGKAFSALFPSLGEDRAVIAGILTGAVLVLFYCYRGGLRASIWTDTAQAIVMLGAMAIITVFTVKEVGGISALIDAISNTDAHFREWVPIGAHSEDHHTADGIMAPLGNVSGFALFLLGWIAGGAGAAGQPHFMVRFMAMRSVKDMTRFRIYYYSWSTLLGIFAIVCGFAVRLLVTEINDTERALSVLSLELLPPALAGLMLAGVFSATISTADSQVLSCSATLSHDLLPATDDEKKRFRRNRFSTVAIVVFAVVITLLARGTSIFSLILLAWGVLASAFVPLLVVYVYGGRVPQWMALCMMAGGIAALFFWRDFQLKGEVYEVLPGVVGGFAVYAAYRIWRRLL